VCSSKVHQHPLGLDPLSFFRIDVMIEVPCVLVLQGEAYGSEFN